MTLRWGVSGMPQWEEIPHFGNDSVSLAEAVKIDLGICAYTAAPVMQTCWICGRRSCLLSPSVNQEGCWSFCNIVGSLPYDIEYHETAALAFSTPVQQNVDYSLLYVSNDIRVVDSICSFELKMLLWVCVKRGIDVTAFTFTDCRSLTLHASHCTDATSQHLENHKIPVNVI